jgi:hypothetical protein
METMMVAYIFILRYNYGILTTTQTLSLMFTSTTCVRFARVSLLFIHGIFWEEGREHTHNNLLCIK